MSASRDALSEALGWDWEPSHGVPSVNAVTDDVLDELRRAGWVLVRESPIADAWDAGYSAGATPLPKAMPRPLNPHRFDTSNISGEMSGVSDPKPMHDGQES